MLVIVKFEFVNTEIAVLLDPFGLVAVKFSFEISYVEILVVTVLNTSLALQDPGHIPRWHGNNTRFVFRNWVSHMLVFTVSSEVHLLVESPVASKNVSDL